MKETLQACAASVEITGAEDWIALMPVGQWEPYDGRGRLTLLNPEAVIAASKRSIVDMVIDRDHQTDIAPAGTPVKAAGWIKEMKVIGRFICGRPDWTATAKAELSAKEYRYISPVYNYDKKTGEVIRIVRASLTNNPAFDMPAIASAQTHNPQTEKKETTTMDKDNTILIAVAAALGLSTTITTDALVAAAANIKREYEERGSALASLRKSAGIADGTDIATACAAVEKLATGKPDPSKYIDITAHTAVTGELASLKKKTQDEQVATAVDAAMKAGKLTPAQKQWATDYASGNLEGFKAFIDKQPVIVSGGTSVAAAAADTTGASELNSAQIAACKAMGLSTEEYKKTLAKDKAKAAA